MMTMTKDHSKEVLRFVSVVFRHGNRAPTTVEIDMLSNDMNSFNNFFPVGFGGLTNEGKQNMYKLGTELRKRYSHFLSDIYIPEQVEARSTSYERTKMSLDVVLAGLYSPPVVQTWNQELNWQPIPTICMSPAQDTLLSPFAATPQYVDEIKRVGSLREVVNKAEEFRPLAKKLTNITGKPIISIFDMWVLYHGLMALKTMNHALPEWANDIFPNGALLDAAFLQYEIFNCNELLKKLNGGMLLKKMIDDMKSTMNSVSNTNGRKINLFSGHEINIVGCLSALGLYKPHVPEYSSALIVELIQRDEDYYVKVIRYLGIPSEFEEQEIWDCGTLCPFDKFIDLTKNVMPSDEDVVRPRESEFDFLSIADQIRYPKFE